MYQWSAKCCRTSAAPGALLSSREWKPSKSLPMVPGFSCKQTKHHNHWLCHHHHIPCHSCSQFVAQRSRSFHRSPESGHHNEDIFGGNDVMEENLDIEWHEVVEDISTDWSGSTEEAVGVTKTKFLFHLKKRDAKKLSWQLPCWKPSCLQSWRRAWPRCARPASPCCTPALSSLPSFQKPSWTQCSPSQPELASFIFSAFFSSFLFQTWIIFSWTFSHTLGTPKNTVGRASFRVETRVPFSASLLAK